MMAVRVPGRAGQRDVVQQLLAVDLEVDLIHLQTAGTGGGLGTTDQGAVGVDQVDVADGDHIALVEDGRPHPDAVDEGPVDALRVPNLGADRRLDQKCVMPRCQDVLNDDVVVVGAADRQRSGRLAGRCRTRPQRLHHLGRQVRFAGRLDRGRGHLGRRGAGRRGRLPGWCGWRSSMLIGRRALAAGGRSHRRGGRGMRRCARMRTHRGTLRRSVSDRLMRSRGRVHGAGPGRCRRLSHPHRSGHRRPAGRPGVAGELEGQPRPVGVADVDRLSVIDVDDRHPATVDESPVQ